MVVKMLIILNVLIACVRNPHPEMAFKKPEKAVLTQIRSTPTSEPISLSWLFPTLIDHDHTVA